MVLGISGLTSEWLHFVFRALGLYPDRSRVLAILCQRVHEQGYWPSCHLRMLDLTTTTPKPCQSTTKERKKPYRSFAWNVATR